MGVAIKNPGYRSKVRNSENSSKAGETYNANTVLFSEPKLKVIVVNKFIYDYSRLYLARYSNRVFVMALCSTLLSLWQVRVKMLLVIKFLTIYSSHFKTN